jgi:hypothetical protein
VDALDFKSSGGRGPSSVGSIPTHSRQKIFLKRLNPFSSVREKIDGKGVSCFPLQETATFARMLCQI